MTEDKANGLIVTSAAVAGVLMLVKDAAAPGKATPVRGLVGLTFASLGLSVLAESTPNIAGGLAALVLLSSVFVYGAPAWTAITNATAPPKTSAKKAN